MALDSQKRDFIETVRAVAGMRLTLLNMEQQLTELWNIEDFFNAITTGDIQSNPEWDFLTANDLSNVINAFNHDITETGAAVDGQKGNLLKVAKKMTVQSFTF